MMRQCGKSTIVGGIMVTIILLVYMLTIQPSFRQSDIDAKRDILWLEKMLKEKHLKEQLSKVKQNENIKTRIYNYRANAFGRWKDDYDDDNDDSSDEDVDTWLETSQTTTTPTQPYSESSTTQAVDKINGGWPLFRGWMFGGSNKPNQGSTTEFPTTEYTMSSSSETYTTTASSEIEETRNLGSNDKILLKKLYNKANSKPFKEKPYEQKNNRFIEHESTTTLSSSSMITTSASSFSTTTNPTVDNAPDSGEVANKVPWKDNENKIKSIEPMHKTSIKVQAENDTLTGSYNYQKQNETVSQVNNTQLKTRILSRLLSPNDVLGVNNRSNIVHVVNKTDNAKSPVLQKYPGNTDLIVEKPIDPENGSNVTSDTAKFISEKNVQLDHAFVPNVNAKLDTSHLIADSVSKKKDHVDTDVKVPNANDRILSVQTFVRQEMNKSSQNTTMKINSSTVNISNIGNEIKDKTKIKTEIEAFMKLNPHPAFMNIFDWNTPLRPSRRPQCVPMQTISSFVRVCIHPISEDPDVSLMLMSRSIWESQPVRDVQLALLKLDDSGLIDLGAGIGSYSLAAASIKKYVIAVEPYLPHVEMFQKSVLLNNLKPFVTLLRNVVSNKHETFIASHVEGHINDVVFRPFSGGEKNDTVIESITLNDLADLVPFKTVILKIDIPNFTRRCLSESDELFSKRNVAYVFMHWENTNEPLCEYLVDFFVGKGYRPYEELNGKEMNTANALHWSRRSVIWKKKTTE